MHYAVNMHYAMFLLDLVLFSILLWLLGVLFVYFVWALSNFQPNTWIDTLSITNVFKKTT